MKSMGVPECSIIVTGSEKGGNVLWWVAHPETNRAVRYPHTLVHTHTKRTAPLLVRASSSQG